MPEAPIESRAGTMVPNPTASATAKSSAPSTKQHFVPLTTVIAVAAVLILAAGIGIWAIKGGRSEVKPPVVPTEPVATSQNPMTAPPRATAASATPRPASPLAAHRPVALAKPVLTLSSARPTTAPGSKAPPLSEPGDRDECLALWTFDQDSGLTAVDGSGHGYNATLVGDHVSWTKDAKVGVGALKLAGASYAETAGPVVDTTRSFTVAAWVNLSAIDKRSCQTVVGMDAKDVGGFYLQLNHASGDRFVFNRMDKDERKGNAIMAKSAFVPVRNTWYYLVGVYDADAQTISLYVDGKLQESVPFTSPWQALGKTSIGRGYYAAANVDFVSGTIDDVRIYGSALTADQIQILADK